MDGVEDALLKVLKRLAPGAAVASAEPRVAAAAAARVPRQPEKQKSKKKKKKGPSKRAQSCSLRGGPLSNATGYCLVTLRTVALWGAKSCLGHMAGGKGPKFVFVFVRAGLRLPGLGKVKKGTSVAALMAENE